LKELVNTINNLVDLYLVRENLTYSEQNELLYALNILLKTRLNVKSDEFRNSLNNDHDKYKKKTRRIS
jgi:hypothetical protein